MSSRNFNVSGFTLPVPWCFSAAPNVQAQVPGISSSPNAAQAFVSRLVMQGVFDVLEQQGRAAGLPDFIIMSILDQLKVNISYTPLECPLVSINPTADVDNGANMMANCVIVSNTVTRICPAMKMCMLNNGAEFISIPSQHMSISGTLTTTNIIMANWTRDMWQSVVNRVLRTLTFGPYGSHFVAAAVTVT